MVPGDQVNEGKQDIGNSGVDRSDIRRESILETSLESEQKEVFDTIDPSNSTNQASLKSPSVAAIQVLHISGAVYHVYVGYGNGSVSVFDFKTAKCLKHWEVPGGGPIIAIEAATQIGVMLILSSNTKLSVWGCKDFRLLRT